MPPKPSPTRGGVAAGRGGAGVRGAGARGRGAAEASAAKSKAPATKSKAPGTKSKAPATKSKAAAAASGADAKADAEAGRRRAAAVTIQCWHRRRLAAARLAALRAERDSYERKMEQLEKEAYVAVVRMQQAAAERQRQKEEEERRMRAEHRKRQKRMLEAAFNGDVAQMQQVLREVEQQDAAAGLSQHDAIGRALRNRHQLQMLDCEDPNGNTPLSEAASGGVAEAVEFLASLGADANSRGQFGRTPLYRAAFAGHAAACEKLLQFGADPRVYAGDAQTPRDVAAVDDVRELLDSWDLEQTEALLRKIQVDREARREEDRRRLMAEMQNLDAQVAAAEKEFAAAESLLRHASEDLNKRIHEHDVAVAEGKAESVAKATLAAIHDAEAEAEAARAQQQRARDKLQQLRLQRREKAAEGREGGAEDESSRPGVRANVRELDDVLLRDVGNRLRDSGRWPMIVDPSGMSCTFLRYRDTNYVSVLDPVAMEANALRMALLGALRYGKPFVLDLMEIDELLDTSCENRFNQLLPGLLQMIIDKQIVRNNNWRRLVRPGDSPEYGDNKAWRLEYFRFFVLTKNPYPSSKYLEQFTPVWVVTPS